jgi:putative hydrolase of the HAD superfamily
MSTVRAIFFDIGGVCLSNGWDHEQRRAITERFGFDYDTFDRRHRQVVDALERGQMTLSDYLRWTVFYEPRPFTSDELTEAILGLSTPFPDTLALVRALRGGGRYLLATLNNESRELNEYRIERFALRELFTVFFSSCYFGLLKPQPEIYRRALQITQCEPEACVYIDDRPMNAEVASILGMRAIQFSSAAQLADDLRAAGVTW